MIANKYGRMNAPPPFDAAVYGNLHILPRPTAEPIAANIKPNLLPHCSLTFYLLKYCEKIEREQYITAKGWRSRNFL